MHRTLVGKLHSTDTACLFQLAEENDSVSNEDPDWTPKRRGSAPAAKKAKTCDWLSIVQTGKTVRLGDAVHCKQCDVKYVCTCRYGQVESQQGEGNKWTPVNDLGGGRNFQNDFSAYKIFLLSKSSRNFSPSARLEKGLPFFYRRVPLIFFPGEGPPNFFSRLPPPDHY